MKEIDRTPYGSIEKPYVTVVVPFYNEEDSIKDCIVSLSKQDFKPLQTLAVVKDHFLYNWMREAERQWSKVQ